jgi:glycine dehydrogenase subunit 1
MKNSAARRHNMFPYIPNTADDEKTMLESIGVSSVDGLFEDIPKELRLKRSLALGSPMSEIEITRHMNKLAHKNLNTDDLVCFLGAGAYDHYIPSVVNHIISRSEFYTAYTPYQAEISQGTLQAIFEYQTMIANLTGMDVANASMYDGATACAEAAKLAVENTKRKKVVVSKTVNPETREVVATYMRFHGAEVVEVDFNDGETDL